MEGTNTRGMGSGKSAAQGAVENQVCEAKGERRRVIRRSLQSDRLTTCSFMGDECPSNPSGNGGKRSRNELASAGVPVTVTGRRIRFWLILRQVPHRENSALLKEKEEEENLRLLSSS
ncbi:hypothetical protein P691DRAFT_787615 [Macrolepiota fuliginosa MF-IS2]|uniref:Uncharacterized protein n=1 Tax=Macrolepiota fuliginosa MF-IS2 TaxID=1400762 RepID=A0A9P5X6I6_9AGAR|nr:hypothetical protein P691DRAFT_787615 [Macrolepiota fuliginosa MF-IS2]